MSDSLRPHESQHARPPCPPPTPEVYLAATAKSLQSCLTLCDPIDSSPPGSPIPGILQARTLEWVAISFSNAWKWKWKGIRSVASDSSWPQGLQPTRLLRPWDLPGKSTGVGCHRLLQEFTLGGYIFGYVLCHYRRAICSAQRWTWYLKKNILTMMHSIWDLISPTRNQICGPCTGSAVPKPVYTMEVSQDASSWKDLLT